MILFLLACFGTDRPGQSGEETIGCFPQSSVAVGLDEVSALGVTPADLIALAEGEHLDTFTWADGTTTGLTVSVTTDPADIAWVDYEYEDDGSGMEIAMDCADALEIGADVQLTTADGAFAESFATTLQAITSAGLDWYASTTLDAVAGSYDAAEIDTSTFNDGVTVFYDGSFTAEGTAGVISGQGAGHDGEGDDGVAFAQAFDIGTWGPVSE